MCSQKILANCKHISWRAFQLLRMFFDAFRITSFVKKNIFDQIQILLTYFFNGFHKSNAINQFN